MDKFNQDIIEGWARNEDDPERSILIEIFDENTLISSVNADRFRLDLYTAKMGNGEYGFSYRIPESLCDGRDHRIFVKYEKTDLNLIGSPFTLTLPISNSDGSERYGNSPLPGPSSGLSHTNQPVLEKMTTQKIRDLGEVIDTRYAGIYTVIPGQEIVDNYLHDEFTVRASEYDRKNADYPYINRLVTDAFDRLEKKPFNKSHDFCMNRLNILDIGTGSGSSVFPLLKKCPNSRIIASDLSPDMLLLLKNNIGEDPVYTNLVLLQLNAEDLAFNDETFDIIIGSSILHHLFSPEVTLQQCKKILKNGGIALFFEPFEIGHGILRNIFEEILNDSRSTALSNKITTLLTSHIMYFDTQRGNDKSSSCFRHLEDKWIFTQRYFEELTELIGFSSLIIYNTDPADAPFEKKVTRFIELLPDRSDTDILPDWAWEKIRRYDSYLSPEVKHSLMFEGCIIMEKKSPGMFNSFLSKLSGR